MRRGVPKRGRVDVDSSERRCPQCGSRMRQVTHGSLTLDECPRQHGMWFDAGELGKFARSQGRRVLREKDVARALVQNPHVSRSFLCPGCGARLDQGQVANLDGAVCCRCSGFLSCSPIRTMNRPEPISSGTKMRTEERLDLVWGVAARVRALLQIIAH